MHPVSGLPPRRSMRASASSFSNRRANGVRKTGSKPISPPLTALINPEFEPVDDELALGWEGCLSIPGITGAVPRYTRIVYRGFLPNGQPVEREATNFHARVVQHEIDHLDGVLFPMRMTDLSLLSFNEELKVFMEHATAQAANNDNGGDQDA